MPDEELTQALEKHPLGRTSQKLLALDLQIHIDPAQRDTLIERAIVTWRNADNDALTALGRWLNSKGEYQRELDTIPLERALQTRDLFLQRLDALGSLGQWTEVKRLLQSENFPLDPVIERMYLARCNQQLKEITAAENNWQRALEAAGNDAQKLLTLADYAEKNGAFQIAATAFDAVTHDAPRVRPAQQGRLRLAQQNRDTRKMHAILAEMLQQWPNDTAIQNDEAYTRLLLIPGGTTSASSGVGRGTRASPSASSSGSQKPEASAQKSDVSNSKSATDPRPPTSDLSKIERLAEELVRRDPASLPHRTLLALALLKQDRPAAALEIYADLQVPPNTASPSAVAVHAAVLRDCGREEDARVEAGALNREQLLPEEQALIETLR